VVFGFDFEGFVMSSDGIVISLVVCDGLWMNLVVKGDSYGSLRGWERLLRRREEVVTVREVVEEERRERETVGVGEEKGEREIFSLSDFFRFLGKVKVMIGTLEN
jgi:hypothetical protein